MLIDEIKKASLQAMKDHDAESRAAYSMVISRYQTLLTSGKGGEITDKDVIAILIKFAKELDEEKQGYVTAGRQESAQALAKQCAAIERFLPKLLSEEEIKSIILGLEDKSIPSVMKHFKAHYDGQVDMGVVSRVARALQ